MMKPLYSALSRAAAAPVDSDESEELLPAADELVTMGLRTAAFISAFRTQRISSPTDLSGLRAGYLSAAAPPDNGEEPYSRFLEEAGRQLVASSTASAKEMLSSARRENLAAMLGLKSSQSRELEMAAGLKLLREELDRACNRAGEEAEKHLQVRCSGCCRHPCSRPSTLRFLGAAFVPRAVHRGPPPPPWP